MFFWTTNSDRLTRYLLSHSPRTYEHVSRPQPLCCVHVQLLIKDTTQPSDFICASFCKSAWGVRTLRSVLIQTSWTVSGTFVSQELLCTDHSNQSQRCMRYWSYENVYSGFKLKEFLKLTRCCCCPTFNYCCPPTTELFCSLLFLTCWVITPLHPCVTTSAVQTLTVPLVEQQLYIFLLICQCSRVVKFCFYEW